MSCNKWCEIDNDNHSHTRKRSEHSPLSFHSRTLGAYSCNLKFSETRTTDKAEATPHRKPWPQQVYPIYTHQIRDTVEQSSRVNTAGKQTAKVIPKHVFKVHNVVTTLPATTQTLKEHNSRSRDALPNTQCLKSVSFDFGSFQTLSKVCRPR